MFVRWRGRPVPPLPAALAALGVESVETSGLHLNVLRDLKRINAHLAAAAYPVLENRVELLSSRLKHEG